MVRSLTTAALVGLGAGGAHFWAHNRFGNPTAFDQAGVTQAGLTVIVAAAALSLLLGQEGRLGLDHPGETRVGRARARLHPAVGRARRVAEA